MEKNVENEIINTIYEVFGLENLGVRDVNDKVVVDSLSNNISFVLKNTDIDRLGFWHQLVEVAKSDKIDEIYVSDNYVLPYPFDRYKIADILTVTDYIYINDFENNGNTREFNADEWKVLKDFLCYNFFLTLEIQEYLKKSYKIQSVGLDMPKVSDYIMMLIEKINSYVFGSLMLHSVPSIEGLMKRLGLKSEDEKLYLEMIIDFYIYNMGLKRVSPFNRELVNVSDEERVDVASIVKTIYEKNIEKLLSKKGLEWELRRNI